MNSKPEAQVPKINIATELWVKEQIMDTENRIEKAFHDQTIYMTKQHSELKSEMYRNNLQTLLAILGVGALIVVAIFIQPLLGG